MKLKLDENFGHPFASIFTAAGFDTHSVMEEGLSGIKDDALFEKVRNEDRCLITFDLDFANIIKYSTNQTPGIIVVRPRRPFSFKEIENFCHQIVLLLKSENPVNCLWILEEDKIRIRKPEGEF